MYSSASKLVGKLLKSMGDSVRTLVKIIIYKSLEMIQSLLIAILETSIHIFSAFSYITYSGKCLIIKVNDPVCYLFCYNACYNRKVVIIKFCFICGVLQQFFLCLSRKQLLRYYRDKDFQIILKVAKHIVKYLINYHLYLLLWYHSNVLFVHALNIVLQLFQPSNLTFSK